MLAGAAGGYDEDDGRVVIKMPSSASSGISLPSSVHERLLEDNRSGSSGPASTAVPQATAIPAPTGSRKGRVGALSITRMFRAMTR